MATSGEALVAAFHRRAAAEAKRQSWRPAQPVADWDPPRGSRAADGHWRWALTERPDDSFGSPAELRAVRDHARVLEQLNALRQERGLSLRRLGQQVAECFPATSLRREAKIGMPLSVATNVLAGSTWGRFDTLALLAQALGHRLQLAERAPRPPGAADDDLAAIEDSWASYGLLAGAWQVIVVSELGSHLAATGMTKTELALRAGLRKNTVSELWTLVPPERWASVRTVAALAHHFHTRLELADRAEPWRTPPAQVEGVGDRSAL